MKTIFIYSSAWLGLVILAILNGILRVKGYSAYMSELCAHQLSTLIGICLFAIFFWALSKIFPLASPKQAWIIGVIWLVLTISFEFLFGHFIMDHSWGKLFADYNILKGRVWMLILFWTFIGPYFFYRISH
jgi:hypothetical protein